MNLINKKEIKKNLKMVDVVINVRVMNKVMQSSNI